MKKFTAALLLVIMLLATACQGKTNDAQAEKIEPNKELKGQVMIYTSMYEDIIDQIKPKVQEKFPNVKVEFFQGGTGAIQSKVAAELSSGKLDCDMLMVAETSYALELKEKKILHAYRSPQADKINKKLNYDKEGYWYPVRISNMVLAYNPEKVKKEDVATSFEKFPTMPNAQGKISMSNPLTSGTALASISGLKDKYGEAYFKALGDAKVAVESGSVALGKLETGECTEIMVLEESVLKKRQEEKSPLECIYPDDGTLVVPSPIMIIDDQHSKNANAKVCEAILDWFLSPEGQQTIVDGWMHSVLEQAPALPYDAKKTSEILDKQMPINWEKTYKEREQLRTEFENYVAVPKK